MLQLFPMRPAIPRVQIEILKSIKSVTVYKKRCVFLRKCSFTFVNF